MFLLEFSLLVYVIRRPPLNLVYAVGFCFLLGGQNRQEDFEGAAFAGNAVGGDCSAVLLDDPPADGQADAGAFVYVAGMQALENAENPRAVFLVEADAVVFDDDAALFVGQPDWVFDLPGRARICRRL